ncbi:MAG: hypothetical protein ACM3SS_20505 [Rhodospirillaceae bacterium]
MRIADGNVMRIATEPAMPRPRRSCLVAVLLALAAAVGAAISEVVEAVVHLGSLPTVPVIVAAVVASRDAARDESSKVAAIMSGSHMADIVSSCDGCHIAAHVGLRPRLRDIRYAIRRYQCDSPRDVAHCVERVQCRPR